jgi:hypothetical protein
MLTYDGCWDTDDLRLDFGEGSSFCFSHNVETGSEAGSACFLLGTWAVYPTLKWPRH